MKRNYLSGLSVGSARIKSGACVVASAFLLVTLAAAQTSSIDNAVAAFRSGNFDEAIGMFSSLSQNQESSIETRQVSLQYLGRAYLAKQMHEEAREAIEALVKLPPPKFKLDPDRESPPLMDLYYDICEQTNCLDEEEYDGTIRTVAVVDFTNGSFGEDAASLDALGLGLASMMINYLGGAIDLRIVEREKIQWVLKEQDLQQDSRRVDPETAVRIGKILGAQSVVIGTFIANGRDMYLGTRLVNVETSEVLNGEQIFGRRADLFELVQKLSLQTATAINAEVDQSVMEKRAQTKSLDAMISYSEGLAFLEKESYNSAYNKFMQAVEYDPGYAQAQAKAESIQYLLN